jgi:hypothetical protein
MGDESRKKTTGSPHEIRCTPKKIHPPAEALGPWKGHLHFFLKYNHACMYARVTKFKAVVVLKP